MKRVFAIVLGTVCVLVVGIVVGWAITRSAYRQACQQHAMMPGVHALDYWAPVTHEEAVAMVDRASAALAEQDRLADEREH